jgi:transposase-like protein
MSRHSAEWWSERVRELTRSGDAEQIAHRHGVRVDTLKWWRWELARRAAEAGPRLLPVVVHSATARSAEATLSDLEVVVEAGAVRIRVHGAVSPEHLAVLMGPVSRAC